MSRDQLADAVDAKYPEKPPSTRSLFANMIWAFYHEISRADYVIARRGQKTLASVGKVVDSAFYSPGKNPHLGHPNYLGVSWQAQPREKVFPSVVFPRHTLTEISEEQFQKLLEGKVPDPPEVAEATEDPNAFVLEKYLDEFIVSNFDTIFKGELKIYEDAEGVAQQYPTDIGSIDVLAVEQKSKSFVVIELKKGRPSDRVIGQVLRYMGWVKKNLCADGQSVKGLVICRERDPKMSYALEMIDNVDVRYYSVSFRLMETP